MEEKKKDLNCGNKNDQNLRGLKKDCNFET